MITYIEDKSDKYPPRTFANAQAADATIAFAVDFETKGELLTKAAAQKFNKAYVPIWVNKITRPQCGLVALHIAQKNIRSINVAGNSIKTLLAHNMDQAMCDAVVMNVLRSFLEYGIEIQSIRSGGQSGADEAGIKCAIKLKIPATVHCPKGWPFITAEGKTIRDEYLFKQRFCI